MKKIFMLIGSLMIMMMCCMGCSNKKDSKESAKYIFYTKQTYCDVKQNEGDIYGLIIPFAYRNEYDDIKLKSVIGENTEDAEIKIVAEHKDFLPKISYRGYKYSQLGLQVNTHEKKISIEKIILEINNKDYEVVFDEKLNYCPVKDTDEVYYGTCPVIISSTENETDLIFQLRAASPVKITDVYMPDNYDCKINNIISGIGNKIPMEIDEGDSISFDVKITKKTDKLFGLNNFIVKYINKDKVEKEYHYLLSMVVNLSDEEILKELLKEIVDEKS